MVKDIADTVKGLIGCDDRFVNEIHQYKIQWPQKKGTVISFSKNRHYEATDLAGLGVSEDILKQIGL